MTGLTDSSHYRFFRGYVNDRGNHSMVIQSPDHSILSMAIEVELTPDGTAVGYGVRTELPTGELMRKINWHRCEVVARHALRSHLALLDRRAGDEWAVVDDRGQVVERGRVHPHLDPERTRSALAEIRRQRDTAGGPKGRWTDEDLEVFARRYVAIRADGGLPIHKTLAAEWVCSEANVRYVLKLAETRGKLRRRSGVRRSGVADYELVE